MARHGLDRIAEVFRGEISDAETIEAARRRIGWIEARLHGNRVLDLGCSQGILSVRAARAGKWVVGSDLELRSLAYAARELSRAGDLAGRALLVAADGENLPFRDGAFDCAVLGELLEHLDRPERVLEEMRRGLRRGGVVLVTTPFGLMPHDDHVRSYYPGSLARTLGPAFTVREMDTQDGIYLRAVAVAEDGASRREVDAPTIAEEGFLVKEQRYLARLDALVEKLEDARSKYRNQTALAKRRKETIALLEREERVLDELTVRLEQVEAALRESRERADRLAARLREIEGSRAWRLVRFYWRFVTDFLRGGGGGRKAFLRSLLGRPPLESSQRVGYCDSENRGDTKR